MSGTTLAKCVQQAEQKGWNAGVMFWEWSQVRCFLHITHNHVQLADID